MPSARIKNKKNSHSFLWSHFPKPDKLFFSFFSQQILGHWNIVNWKPKDAKTQAWGKGNGNYLIAWSCTTSWSILTTCFVSLTHLDWYCNTTFSVSTNEIITYKKMVKKKWEVTTKCICFISHSGRSVVLQIQKYVVMFLRSQWY